ncbi:hypothetical protein MAR_011309 [Mya arenaria]|uniref:Uncharacterized protein n=1 Tax=Mya arenaria TaxID=6604 RepID=A0ABY7FUG1_MYAAR|nr:hypothetical protein MAR_011309 [Mya arenaria]
MKSKQHTGITKRRLSKETVQEDLMFISNDMTHDANAVHSFVTLANKHLQQRRGLNIEHELSFLMDARANTSPSHPFDYCFPIERHLYGSRHEKGPSDGAGAVLKCAARRAV